MRYVKASGDFDEVGYEVGKACQDIAAEVYESSVNYLLNDTKAKNFTEVKEIVESNMAITREVSKECVDYLYGQAEGAGITPEMIALTSFVEEASSEVGLKPPEKCSTLVVRLEDTVRIFHNEDFPENKVLIANLEFRGRPPLLCVPYVCQLWGSGLGLNGCKVAITNNGQHLKVVRGVPKQVPQSLAMLARKMSRAEDLLGLSTAVPSHYIVGWGETGEVISLFVSNFEASHCEVKLHVIREQSFPFTNHVPNGWISLKMPDPAIENSPTSVPRYNVLNGLMPEELPGTLQEGIDFFSNQDDDNLLVRKSEKPGESKTIFTAAIDLKAGQIWIRDADLSAEKRDWHFSLRDGHFYLDDE